MGRQKLLLLAVLVLSLPNEHQAFVLPSDNRRQNIPQSGTFRLPGSSNDLVNRHGRSSQGTPLFVAAPREETDKNESPLVEEDDSSPPARFTPPAPHDEDWVGSVRGSRFIKLKDMIWIRETVEDLTAAEFACSVELAAVSSSEESRKRRRAVDYDKLLGQLNKRLRDMGCLVDDENENGAVFCDLNPSVGKGTTVYDEEQRSQLYE